MKKIVVLLIVFLLIGSNLMTCEVNAFQNRFSDVKEDDWFMEDVNVLSNDRRQIINGYPDGSFKPNNMLTVEEFITMVVRASNFFYQAKQGEYWATPYIDKSIELGYVETGEFDNYERVITRGEMARIIERTLWVIEGEQKYANLTNYSRCITDTLEIPEELRDYVYKIYGLGIILGYPDNSFRANNGLIRAEGATVVRRLIDHNQRKPFMNLDEDFREDLLLIDSNLSINAPNREYNTDLEVCLDYSNSIETQLVDLEELFLRRYSKENVSIILSYIKQKTGIYDLLPEKEKWFLVEGNSICIHEHQQTGKNNLKRGLYITINSWFGDEMYNNSNN